jgi:hypothetical protein
MGRSLLKPYLLNPLPPLSHARQPMIWVLMGCWLVYSFATLAWYLMNDPAFMASICKVN